MATSTLRAIVLAAAVILGVVGLTKAFPSGTSPVTPTGGTGGGTPSASASPSTPASPTPSATPRAPEEVVVQVLNGSGVTGLAASKTNKVKKAGYNTKEPGDWPNHVNNTIVYYKAGFRVDAEFI
ncbi:MAG TPA: LytR C-terminal domain-containing protein, partial [Actinomycetota bacterium]|nr:LytR C-terminal domain-containing protein [Actinomycetota bacterium]